MRLIEKLKEFEQQYVFIKWAMGCEYGKLVHAGEDFVEFDVIDTDTMDYQETILLNQNLILEVAIGGSDISRILAEVSCNLDCHEKD